MVRSRRSPLLESERISLCAILAEDISSEEKRERLDHYLKSRKDTANYGSLRRVVICLLDRQDLSSVRRLPYKVLTH